MSVRRLIVDVDLDGLNVRQFCREHGISTWSFYALRRRYARDGDAALEPKSRAPHRVANRIGGDVENLIVELRKELDDAGLDAGPVTIRWHLQARGAPRVPSEATIWRTLNARGLIIAQPEKAPKHAGKRFVAARANELWQTDDTAWMLVDGTEVKVLNVLDDHSRLAVASVAATTVTGTVALNVFAAAAAVLGWPARFLSDNAKAFRHVLADALGEIGVAATHSRVRHPQTNGKVERFHQTLKRWLAKQPPAETIGQLQAQLDQFRFIYNHQRPHRAIGRKHPADVWAAAPKTGPANRPFGARTHLYRGTVHGGKLRLGSRWRITIGTVHNNKRALAVVTGLACHVFIDGRLARALTLNPDRVDQPLHPRAGRPTFNREG